jgi:hypothetical protein
MMARRPAAMITIHLAQASGQKKTASMTIPKASRKRQKHNFMIFLSFPLKFYLSYKKNHTFSSLKKHFFNL